MLSPWLYFLQISKATGRIQFDFWPAQLMFLFFFFYASASFSLPTGGSLSGDLVTDEEMFIRWLEIAAFLPVISFHTPPWVCGEDRVYNQNLIRKTQTS